MALANIMMWLASTGNVILAKGFLRYLWRAQPATPGEKRNRGRAREGQREGSARVVSGATLQRLIIRTRL